MVVRGDGWGQGRANGLGRRRRWRTGGDDGQAQSTARAIQYLAPYHALTDPTCSQLRRVYMPKYLYSK